MKKHIFDESLIFNILPNGQKMVRIRSDCIKECLQFYVESKSDCLGISESWGFSNKTPLNFLADCPFVTGLDIVDGNKRDLKTISNLTWLKYLRLGDAQQAIDLSALENLEELLSRWTNRLKLPLNKSRLLRLRLTGYKSVSYDLQQIVQFPNLDTLSLTGGNIRSLKCIKNFNKLKNLDLAYIKTLRYIGDIVDTQLEFLHIEHCRQIVDLEDIGGQKTLRVVRLSGLMPLNSLKFISSMSSLVEFRFVNTDVLDNDMLPLLRLKNVSFMNKKKFSHTEKEIIKSIENSK